MADEHLGALAELLKANFHLEDRLEKHSARMLRTVIHELAVDLEVGEDVTEITHTEWEEHFGWEHGNVELLLDLIVQSGILRRDEGRLFVADWQAVSTDEAAAAGRRWSRGRHGDDTDKTVIDINVARHPGEGFPQQDLFVDLIQRINDEDNLLVKFMRSMRMVVGGKMQILDERTWQMLLETAHIVVDMHERRDDFG